MNVCHWKETEFRVKFSIQEFRDSNLDPQLGYPD
jgi:hypothetical protein